MAKKSLFDTNRYLRDPKKYRAALVTSVSSSTAIETGASVEAISKQIADASSDQVFTLPSKPKSSTR